MARKEIKNLDSFSKNICDEGLFLAVVTNFYDYPQLVIASRCPSIKGVKAFCFFVFPFVITRTDSGNKLYTPSDIHELVVYPYKKKIVGISDGMLNQKISEFEENIEKLKIKAIGG